jgi:hypothetical protein
MTVATKTLTAKAVKTKAKKTAIVTYRFSVTPKMNEMLGRLEEKFVMLDRTDIVKLSISRLLEAENLLDNGTSFDEALDYVNSIKSQWRK